MSEIISRADAKAQGLKRYFTGKPCKHGHVAERQISDSKCCECHKARIKDYFSSNPDKAKKFNAAYYKSNSDKVRDRVKSYRAENSDKVHAWQEAYLDKHRANKAAWYAANRENESIRAKSANRRARHRAAEGSHTATDIQRIYADQSGKCVCCGKDLNGAYHVDHFMPLVLGGSNWPNNLQALCGFCNISKGAKHPYDFSLHYAQRHGVWPLFAIARGWDVQQIAA